MTNYGTENQVPKYSRKGMRDSEGKSTKKTSSKLSSLADFLLALGFCGNLIPRFPLKISPCCCAPSPSLEKMSKLHIGKNLIICLYVFYRITELDFGELKKESNELLHNLSVFHETMF